MDTRVVNLLAENAATDATLTFSKTLPIGVSMMEHFASFANIIEKAKSIIYKKTRRFAPTYMVVASDVLPVLAFVPTYKPANTTNINGPYFAG